MLSNENSAGKLCENFAMPCESYIKWRSAQCFQCPKNMPCPRVGRYVDPYNTAIGPKGRYFVDTLAEIDNGGYCGIENLFSS